ncbi:LysO family transporter [Marinomonas mediterranea]|uniref:lysine exporter LysO family protein n=1 Tax=Marinomonas mediterranea TaxID=119864 RepID=UPI002349EA88|nr:LysO family transporter [Marinomonas mediterranea]WCN14661.1 LysO family transporter [Marinomonas mediterranea]
MTILSTLGPLLASLLVGFWFKIPFLNQHIVSKSLSYLTYLILGFIGYSIGALDNLMEKVAIAGTQAAVLFLFITLLPLIALWISGQFMHASHSTTLNVDNKTAMKQALIDATITLAWVIAGTVLGFFLKHWLSNVDEFVTWLLYALLLLVGCQLRQENHRLRKLFLNKQGGVIALMAISTTLIGGLIGGALLGLNWNHSLAAVSGFGWYSLSGILITGLGDPVLGTTAFLLDISREIVALMLVPFLARINSHMSVGYAGATAMDFTLPLLGKCHGVEVVPVCIASGFIMSFSVPFLIPLFMGL